MTTFAWPTSDLAFSQLEAMVWKPRLLSDSSESPLNGDVQTTTRVGARWSLSLTFFAQTWAERRRVIAFLERLNGQEHRISLIDPTNPSPQGTIALSGVTLNATAAQFAESIQLANCGAGATIKRGDWLKLGGQAVKCVVDATADGAGVMTVPIRHRLRQAVSSGSSVTTNNVSALYILASPDWAAGYNGSHADPFAIDLIEVFA
jgi:hypothetical protein